MSLTVTRARVKEKCSISETTYDTTIDNLIAEIVPALAAQLEEDASAIANLNLGATEIVCAELLCQLAREPGATERVNLNGMEISGRRLMDDAAALRAQGQARLSPYRRNPGTVLAIPGKEVDE